MTKQRPGATDPHDNSTPLADQAEGDERSLRELIDLLHQEHVARGRAEQLLADERVQLSRMFELSDRERRLLGFEIHDGIVQDLTAAILFLQGGMAELAAQRQLVPVAFDTCERLIGGCINEARRLMAGLQPPQLSELGLSAAVRGLAEEVSQRGITTVHVSVDPTLGVLAPPLELVVYRLVQESLNNVWQHSKAGRVDASVTREGEHLRIVVRDNGVGFDPTQVKKHHYGLLGIRERAQLFGGQAKIESQPGAGTTVSVTLPLRTPAHSPPLQHPPRV